MDKNSALKVNCTDVLHEIFDDEVVIINLKSGIYYSLNNSARIVWQLILENLSPQQVMRVFSLAAPEENGGYGEKIIQFIDELVKEGLVSPGEEPPVMPEETMTQKLKDFSRQLGPGFDLPLMEKYTDQQELLLLDPIHEVSDLGWPDKSFQDSGKG
jgi:hypothetical protein